LSLQRVFISILTLSFFGSSAGYGAQIDLIMLSHIADHHASEYASHRHDSDENLMEHDHSEAKNESDGAPEHSHRLQAGSNTIWYPENKIAAIHFDSPPKIKIDYRSNLNISDFTFRLFRPPQRT